MTPSTAIQVTVAGAAMTWALVLPAAAYAAADSSEAAWQTLAFAVYGLGSVICHQAVARSFVLLDTQLPVCARCTGLYVGAAVMSIVWIQRMRFVPYGTSNRLPEGVSGPDARRVLALGFIPTAATLAYEWSMGDVPSNGIRALAGVALGLAVTSVLLGMCGTGMSAGPRASRVGSDARDPGAGRTLRRG